MRLRERAADESSYRKRGDVGPARCPPARPDKARHAIKLVCELARSAKNARTNGERIELASGGGVKRLNIRKTISTGTGRSLESFGDYFDRPVFF